jgi:hypothetical protein
MEMDPYLYGGYSREEKELIGEKVTIIFLFLPKTSLARISCVSSI